VATKKSVKKASVKAKSEVIEAVDAIEEAVEATAESVLARVNKNLDLVLLSKPGSHT